MDEVEPYIGGKLVVPLVVLNQSVGGDLRGEGQRKPQTPDVRVERSVGDVHAIVCVTEDCGQVSTGAECQRPTNRADMPVVNALKPRVTLQHNWAIRTRFGTRADKPRIVVACRHRYAFTDLEPLIQPCESNLVLDAHALAAVPLGR